MIDRMARIRAGFCTTRACGPDGIYELKIRFQSLDDLDGADQELRDALEREKAHEGPLVGDQIPCHSIHRSELARQSGETGSIVAMTTEHTKTAEGWVTVPLAFVQGFNTLAHNYSLKAVPPDYYAGTEGDAFSAAYRRCGADLANLRAMLAAAPKAPHADPAQQATKGECILCHGTGKHYQAMAILPGQPECAAKLVDCKQCAAPLAAQQAPVQPAGADGKEWRVGLFISSADPRKRVRVLSEGAQEIAEHEAHRDFISWLYAAPGLPEAEKALPVVARLRDALASVTRPIGNMVDRHEAIMRRVTAMQEYQSACSFGSIEKVLSHIASLESLLASKDAEIERLRADAGSVERNRDMWKGQCERQAEALTSLRGQMRVLTALLSECLGPLEVSAAIFESDDAEPLEELITKVQKALAALSAKAIGGEHV